MYEALKVVSVVLLVLGLAALALKNNPPNVVAAEPTDQGYEQITKYTYRTIDHELGNVCYRTAVSGGAISCVPLRTEK